VQELDLKKKEHTVKAMEEGEGEEGGE